MELLFALSHSPWCPVAGGRGRDLESETGGGASGGDSEVGEV